EEGWSPGDAGRRRHGRHGLLVQPARHWPPMLPVWQVGNSRLAVAGWNPRHVRRPPGRPRFLSGKSATADLLWQNGLLVLALSLKKGRLRAAAPGQRPDASREAGWPPASAGAIGGWGAGPRFR